MYEPCPHGCNHAASDCHRRDSCCHESEDAAVAAEEAKKAATLPAAPGRERVLRAQLADALSRVKKLEEELLGPKCEQVECPDYDGEHPYHITTYIKGYNAGQQKQYKHDQQKIAVLQASAERLEIEKAQLAKFKAYVHERLDQDGIPVDPPSEHREAGCRVGGRLDWVFAELARAKACALNQSVAAETERMRLAACCVVALSDTPASAAENRNMHSDYRSPACDAVARIVDEVMDLRTKFAAIRAMAAACRPSDPPAPCCGQPTSAHDQTSPTCPKSSVEWNPVTGKVSAARTDLFPGGSTVSETRFGARVDIPASPEQPVTVDQLIDALKYVKKFNHCHRCLCSMCQLINTVLEKNSP